MTRPHEGTSFGNFIIIPLRINKSELPEEEKQKISSILLYSHPINKNNIRIKFFNKY